MKLYYLISFCFLFSLQGAMAQTYGCTDALASNYNSSATINDGSCTYTSNSVSPISSYNLSDTISETSGLLFWNEHFWTQNDDTDNHLYALDSSTGVILQGYEMYGVTNTDWEEISQDSNYLYIGDFGNNANGNRTDLKVLRIDKNSILNNTPIIDTINYSYVDQTNFTATSGNNTDFDCEAFVVSTDSIYLFTKQWISHMTCVYALPKTPGTYIATLKTTYNVDGLITGAVYLESKHLLALCGYSSLLQPFMYLLYDFTDANFFSANKRQFAISLPYHQIEGITTIDGLTYYMTNEYFTYSQITNPQQLHTFDLSIYTNDYINGNTLNIASNKHRQLNCVYPNPVDDIVTIKSSQYPINYSITTMLGASLVNGSLKEEYSHINVSVLNKGLYLLKLEDNYSSIFKLIKR